MRRAHTALALFAAGWLGLAAALSPALAAPATPAAASAPLDLAALQLEPADVGQAGFGIANVVEAGMADRTAFANAYAQGIGLTPAALGQALAKAGFQRQYLLVLALPQQTGQVSFKESIDSYIQEYQTATGATSGFKLIEDISHNPGATIVRGTKTLGTRSPITDFHFVTSDGTPTRALDLEFQAGTLDAGVTINIFGKTGSTATPARPAVATIEGLAAKLLAKIQAARQHPGPGLANRILRLSGNATAQGDYYLRLGGRELPLYGETAQDRARRGAFYGDATDVYDVDQAIPLTKDATGPAVYTAAWILRFPSTTAATNWLKGMTARIKQTYPDYTNIGTKPAPARLGDETQAVTWTVPASGSQPQFLGARIYVRVGREVAMAWLEQPGTAAPKLTGPLLTLARAQTACLRAPNRLCAATPAPPASAFGVALPEGTPAAVLPGAAQGVGRAGMNWR